MSADDPWAFALVFYSCDVPGTEKSQHWAPLPRGVGGIYGAWTLTLTKIVPMSQLERSVYQPTHPPLVWHT
jgi:hypothetical protein